MITWSSAADFKKQEQAIASATQEMGLARGFREALIGREPVNVGSGQYIRADVNRADYDYYRSTQKIPERVEDSIAMCNKVYEEISIVRSVIDMMADFTVHSIRIEHRDPAIQSFLDQWATHVDFLHVSERIANTLYRIANCPVKIAYGKVPLRIERDWKKTTANEVLMKDEKVYSKRIPLQYNILNPLTLKVIGGELAHFVGKPVYGYKPSSYLVNKIKKYQADRAKHPELDELIKLLPSELNSVNINGQSLIPIKPENLEMIFYKKDDWRIWALPIIHAILKPLFRMSKMELADDKALDGAISQVRLWRLGSFEYKVFPSREAINKLRETLANIGSGDVMDIIWGPDLEFVESESKSYNFLKSEKYTQVMTQIYAGLGVPPSLTGSENDSGFSNNSVSMKTLIERLEYGRRLLTKFWTKELKKLQTAFDWKHAPVVTFDSKVMVDENTEKQIILDLWDRDLISDQKVLQIFNQDDNLENYRIRKNKKDIFNGKRPVKSSPYHNPNVENDLKKIILQSGGVAPSEVGLELKKRKNGEETQHDITRKEQLEDRDHNDKREDQKIKNAPVKEDKNTAGPGGRPSGTKDSSKRQRTEKPRQALSFINLFNWSNDIQDKIHELLTPYITEKFSKANLRQLNKEESQEFEDLKVGIFAKLEPFEKFNVNRIIDVLEEGYRLDPEFVLYKTGLIQIYLDKNGKYPTVKDLRQIQSSAYASLYS